MLFPKKNKLLVVAKRWTDKSAGNTYNSVRIYQNASLVATLPADYGYEEAYLQRVKEWAVERYEDVTKATRVSEIVETPIAVDVATEKELDAWGE